MDQNKTTKGIIDGKLAQRENIPLYNAEALQRIQASIEKWKEQVIGDKDKENWSVVPNTILGSGIAREMIYTPLSTPEFDYMDGLGLSGEEPYTRGIHARMYRGRMFTIRQLCGAGSQEQINRRIKLLLDHGATGVNLILDLPTIQMFDSDEPEARGQVGTVGCPIDCVEDMEVIFQNIPIENISVSLVAHYPRNTAILFSMYLVMAERRGIPWSVLTGSVQNDFIMETVVRNAPEYIPPKDVFRIQCDNIEFIRKNVPKWNFITLNGYNLREFGTSSITEMAVAITNAIETLEEMKRRGYSVDWVGERLAFFWSAGNDFFEEVARLRAIRRLWFRIMRYRFENENPRANWMRCHVQTSGISLAREEPMNNVVRAAYHALAAILGGAQSLHVDSYDEAYSVPSEDASLLSLRTQQIVQVETGITDVVDPLGGSYYVEALSDDIEKRILDEVDEIERMGGIIEAVEAGWLQSKITNYIKYEQRKISDGEIQIVGRNYFRSNDLGLPEIWVQEHDQSLEEQMRWKLTKFRQQRNNKEVNDCLGALGEACERGGNVMAYCIEAARSGATEGEMRKVFREAFGGWQQTGYR